MTNDIELLNQFILWQRNYRATTLYIKNVIKFIDREINFIMRLIIPWSLFSFRLNFIETYTCMYILDMNILISLMRIIDQLCFSNKFYSAE